MDFDMTAFKMLNFMPKKIQLKSINLTDLITNIKA